MKPSSPEADPLSTAAASADGDGPTPYERAEAALLVEGWRLSNHDLDPFPECSPLDPDGGRSGGRLELRLLDAALHCERRSEPAPHGPSRLGYTLLGQPGDPDDEARAWPSFAAALAAGVHGPALAEQFPDIWTVDLALWKAIGEGATPAELARAWLRAPGRRLLFDLTALDDAGRAGSHRGAAGLSLDALMRAAGADDADTLDAARLDEWLDMGPPAWRAVHAAVPGATVERWAPAGGGVVQGLRLLESADPLEQAAAMRWLIHHARTTRHYRIGQLTADLRMELPVRLAAALSERPVGAPLAIAALRHAQYLAGDRPVRAVWSLARWLMTLGLRSPLYGGDAEALTARLNALLPAEPVGAPTSGLDVLHPSRMQAEDLPDIAFVGAVAALVAQGHDSALPAPVIDRLVEVADRDVGDAPGVDAPDGLGWCALTEHTTAPHAARRLCTRLGADWLSRVGRRALDDSLRALRASPIRFTWVAEAMFTQRETLDDAQVSDGAVAYRQLAGRADVPARVRVLLAAAVLDALDADEQTVAAALAGRADPDWRPWLLGAIAEHTSHESVRVSAVEALLGSMEDDTLDVSARLNSALVALRRISGLEPDAQAQWRKAFLERVQHPPHRSHIGLSREINRLGWTAS